MRAFPIFYVLFLTFQCSISMWATGKAYRRDEITIGLPRDPCKKMTQYIIRHVIRCHILWPHFVWFVSVSGPDWRQVVYKCSWKKCFVLLVITSSRLRDCSPSLNTPHRPGYAQKIDRRNKICNRLQYRITANGKLVIFTIWLQTTSKYVKLKSEAFLQDHNWPGSLVYSRHAWS